MVFPELFPKRQILNSSKLKQYAGDNVKFDKIVESSLKQVENSVGKGEIACHEQFLLSFSHSDFKRLGSQGHQKVSLCGNGLRDYVAS